MNELDKYNNTYNDSQIESYIYESCSMCGKDMVNIKDIFIDTDKDTYICSECGDKYDLSVVRCAEY